METERSDVNPFTPPENDKNVLAEPIVTSSVASFSWTRMLAYALAFGLGSLIITLFSLTIAVKEQFPRLVVLWIVTALMGAFGGCLGYIVSWAIRRALFGTDDSSASCTLAKHLTHDQGPEA